MGAEAGAEKETQLKQPASQILVIAEAASAVQATRTAGAASAHGVYIVTIFFATEYFFSFTPSFGMPNPSMALGGKSR